MKLEQLVKKIPQLKEQFDNDDYEIEKAKHYIDYYVFGDDSVVISRSNLEMYGCDSEQEWFWSDFSDGLEEEWIFDSIDTASKWKSNISDFASDLFCYYLGEELYEGVVQGSLEQGIAEVYSDSSVHIESTIRWIKHIEFDFKDVFVDCYSKTEQVFVLGDYGQNEEEAARNIAASLGQTEPDDVVEAITEGMRVLGKGQPNQSDSSNIPKFINLLEQDAESITQAFQLAEVIGDAAINDAIKNSKRVRSVVDKIGTAKKVVEDIDPSAWDGTYLYDPPLLLDYIVEKMASTLQLQGDKPYSFSKAFWDKEDKWREYIYINDSQVNYELCKDYRATLDLFSESTMLSNKRYKKIYEMKDWFIALK
jgi:hypothetical protein